MGELHKNSQRSQSTKQKNIVKMKRSTEAVLYFSSFTMSAANNLLNTESSDLQNNIISTEFAKTHENSTNFSSEIEDPWWNWCAIFAVFSVVSVIFLFALLYMISKCFPVQEKEIIKFSSQKTKDGWYSDNLLATEHRILGQCNVTKNDFIVVW